MVAGAGERIEDAGEVGSGETSVDGVRDLGVLDDMGPVLQDPLAAFTLGGERVGEHLGNVVERQRAARLQLGDEASGGLPRWHTPSTDGLDPPEPNWDDPDPLRGTLTRFLDHTTGPTCVDAQVAVRHWILATAARYNDGHHWPHPAPRRSFPPPMLAADVLDEPIR